jgi:hypothetical protein
MKGPKPSPSQVDWKKRDRRIMYLFIAMLGLTVFGSVSSGVFYLKQGFLDIVDSILGGLTIVFWITGVLAFYYYRRTGIVPTKRILKLFAKFALAFAIVPTLLLLVFEVSPTMSNSLELLAATVAIYLVMVLVLFVIPLMFIIAGFGMMSITSIAQKRLIPDALVQVKGITANAQDSSGIKIKKKGMEYPALNWLFAIPNVLDTGTLTVDKIAPRKTFPWAYFKTAMMWEVFFSAVLAIYVSLNPFMFEIAGNGSIQNRLTSLFSLTLGLSFFIPIFVIPWFTYHRVNARIKGPVKDFRLFDGIKSRMVGTLVAFGTMIVFIRFALRDIDAILILREFVIFYFFFSIVVAFATFVYFNYFADDLARYVVDAFNREKDQAVFQASDLVKKE